MLRATPAEVHTHAQSSSFSTSVPLRAGNFLSPRLEQAAAAAAALVRNLPQATVQGLRKRSAHHLLTSTNPPTQNPDPCSLRPGLCSQDGCIP